MKRSAQRSAPGDRVDVEPVPRRAAAQPALNRREAITLIGSAVVLARCGSDDSETSNDGAAGSAGAADNAANGTVWARGGTQALAASYPDPLADPLASTCSLSCRETLGPCYASTVFRTDISEGYPGLPLRLMLLVVDESCSPVPGATIDIWHTRNIGKYSGDDDGLGADGTPGGFVPTAPPPGVDAAALGGLVPGTNLPAGALSSTCTGGDADAQGHSYFRGTQTTDAFGRLHFDTCYPGWYAGRALHIHFIVRRGGQEDLISQFYFPEQLTAEICASHPDYSERGQPDTVNSTDAFFTGEEHVLDMARQADGAMLAWKTIVLRNSLDEASCGTDGFRGEPLADG
jgi:protocatechuate 3,4-dioxygenase beta subunit